MKKLLFALLIFVTTASLAQVIPPYNPKINSSNWWLRGKFDTLHIPVRNCLCHDSKDSSADLFVYSVDSSLYIWYAGLYRKLGGSGGGVIDTTSLSDRINLRLLIADTIGNYALYTFYGKSAGGDLSGNYPNPTVAQFNGQLPSYYLNYLNLTNKPTIPTIINLVDTAYAINDSTVTVHRQGGVTWNIKIRGVGGSSGSAITSLIGDGTASGPGAASFTLSTVNSTSGVHGDSASTAVITYDSKGRISGYIVKPILITESQVTNLVSDLANKQAALGFTAENVANKTATASTSTTTYPNWAGVENYAVSLAQRITDSTNNALALVGKVSLTKYQTDSTANAAAIALKKNISDSTANEGYTTRYKAQQDSIAAAAVSATKQNTITILPVVNGGTGTSTPGLVAGTNVTITGSWPNNTVNATGGGGIADLAGNGQYTKNQIDSLNGFSQTIKGGRTNIDTATSNRALIGGINAIVAKGAWFNGDSQTGGGGLTGIDTLQRFTKVICTAFGWTEYNRAIGGSGCGDTTSANDLFKQLVNIPNYNGSIAAYFLFYGGNDATALITGPNWAAVTSRCIDTMIINRGIPANLIHFIFNTDPNFTNGTQGPLMKAYHDSLAAICPRKGIQFLDYYAVSLLACTYQKGLWVSGLHYGVQGQNALSNFLIPRISNYITQDAGTSAMVASNIDISKMIFRQSDTNNTNTTDAANASIIARNRFGNLTLLDNGRFLQNNPWDSLAAGQTANISGGMSAITFRATSSWLAGFAGQTVATPGLYLGYNSGQGGIISVENGLSGGYGLPIKLGITSSTHTIISSYFATDNGDQLQSVGSSDFQGHVFIQSATTTAAAPANSLLTVGSPSSTPFSEAIASATGAYLNKPFGVILDGTHTINTTYPMYAAVTLRGDSVGSSVANVTATDATALLITQKSLPRGSYVIGKSYGIIDSIQSKFTDTVRIAYGSPTAGMVLGAVNSSGDAAWTNSIASPTLTGTPTAPTATAGTNTTQIATTAFVQAAIPAKPIIVSSAYISAQTTAQTIATYTTGGADSSFIVSAYTNIIQVTSDVIQTQYTYTDAETNTLRTVVFNNFSNTGTVSVGLAATGPSNYSVSGEIRVKASTTITVATVLTTGIGTITYSSSATITKLHN